jgi:hypothetical protein
MAAKFDDDDRDDAKRMLRISDMVEEPRKMLMPIKGYENVPLVSLEEAVQPLVPFVPDVRRMAWTAKERCEEPADGLTCDESASIMLYSMEWEPHQECLYFVLNATLRAANRRNLSAWFLYLRLMLTALSRLPSVPLAVYRGIKLDLLKDYPQNKRFVWWGFSSCTRAVGVLETEQFLGKKGDRTLFTINCYSGKNIRNHSYFEKEDEILLLAARQFKVASTLNSGNGLHIIQIDEIEPEYPLLEPLPSIAFYVAPSSEALSTSKHISMLKQTASSKTTSSDSNSITAYGQVILLSLSLVTIETLDFISKDLILFLESNNSDIFINTLDLPDIQ